MGLYLMMPRFDQVEQSMFYFLFALPPTVINCALRQDKVRLALISYYGECGGRPRKVRLHLLQISYFGP